MKSDILKPIKDRKGENTIRYLTVCCSFLAASFLFSCAPATMPGARDVNIPTPMTAQQRKEALNERPDSVMYLPLGEDVLVPEIAITQALPNDFVGPFELRNETVAGALQLILADYDISLAFETDEGLTRTVTVANLKGPIDRVVSRVCGLADLYCSYEEGLIIVRESQTFTVKIPPISSDEAFMSNVATGIQAITGSAPIIDQSTRTIVYEATQRTSSMVERYLQRMRSSTALIVFETYIWEVSLNSGNSSGVQWDTLADFGAFNTGISLSGNVGNDFTNPVSIGLPTRAGTTNADGAFAPTDVVRFLSQFGAVKTISQPQISVLSGSEARLRVADTENFVAEVTETLDDGQSSVSVNTDSVDTGFTITIASAWDNASIYADLEIILTDVSEIEDFDFSTVGGGSNRVQLPRTTERELETQVRMRPGDSVLIAGLVRENDNFDTSGPGFSKPLFPSNRTAQTTNLELVFLLRPRVVVYTNPVKDQDLHLMAGGQENQTARKTGLPMGSLSVDLLDPAAGSAN